MEAKPSGVLDGSESYFCTPSSMARRMLLYQLFCGHFYCDSRYDTRRDDFGCYLLLYVAAGECFARTPKRSFTAGPGQVLFLDCHQPHEYGCLVHTEFYWLHFDGVDAAPFYSAVSQSHGELFSREESVGMGVFLRENFTFFSGGVSPSPWNPMGEVAFSARCYQELCGLLACNPPVSPGDENAVNRALAYLQTHFAEPVTVDSLARDAHMSTAYFSRLFKKKTGSSPYEYLIRYRIDQAKYLLRSTGSSIEEVAYASGFGSASNFVYTFTRRTGMPPGKFRKVKF